MTHPLDAGTTGSVAAISSAPVKGLGLVAHDAVTLTRTGIPGDRRYALLDPAGRMANGKRLGPLLAIRVDAAPDGSRLALRFPDGTVLDEEVRLGGPVDGVFYGVTRPATEVLGPWGAVLSERAGEPLRLVRVDGDGGLDRADDGGHVTLLSVAALEAMAAAAGLGAPVDGRRFRMTLLVDGVPAHAEDGWLGRDVRVGDAVVRPLGNVGRCAVTTRDPDTGVRTLDTLRILAETRGHLPTTEPLPFGVWARVVTPGRVEVGSPVRLVDGA